MIKKPNNNMSTSKTKTLNNGIIKMENTQEEFVPYKESFELNELGFNEPCLYYYNTDRKLFQVYNKYKINDTFKNSEEDFNIMLSAPLWQQAFKWFRKKYNLHSQIQRDWSGDKIIGFDYRIDSFEGIEDGNTLETYEEAEIACLIKLIEIVKSRKQNNNGN